MSIPLPIDFHLYFFPSIYYQLTWKLLKFLNRLNEMKILDGIFMRQALLFICFLRTFNIVTVSNITELVNLRVHGCQAFSGISSFILLFLHLPHNRNNALSIIIKHAVECHRRLLSVEATPILNPIIIFYYSFNSSCQSSAKQKKSKVNEVWALYECDN